MSRFRLYFSLLSRARTSAAALGLLAFLLATLPAGAAPATPRPWYAERLEKLGFTVLPSPVKLEDFTLPAAAGGSGSLFAQKGKIVLLNFWATWCPPCRAEMPSIESLWKKTRDKDFTIMGISVGEQPQTVKDFIAREKYSYPVYLDSSGAIGTRFGARSIPTTYLVDKSGMAIAGIVGGIEYDSAAFLALVSELAAR